MTTLTLCLETFGALVVAHAICDYPLQGDFLSKAKSRLSPMMGVPWYQALAAHAVMHGGAVWFITGYWWLGLIEVVMHAVIDDSKCMRKITFNQDQGYHLICKGLYAMAVAVLA